MRESLLTLMLHVGCVASVTRTGLSAVDLPLNQYPFIEAHDAATGYLEPEHLVQRIIYDWTKTQSGSMGEQLDCGARAFDWRPRKENGTLVFHHGSVTVPHAHVSALEEVVTWANNNVDAEHPEHSLVLINAWDCVGEGGCNYDMLADFDKLGVPILTNDRCDELWNMTVGAALEAGRLAGGGSVLAHNGCAGPDGWVTYTDEYECSGFLNTTAGDKWRAEVQNCVGPLPFATSPHEPHPHDLDLGAFDWSRILECAKTLVGIIAVPSHYNCHRPLGLHHDYAFDRMLQFSGHITSLEPPAMPNARLYSALANWAEGIEDVVLGFLHASSLLGDEHRSGLNAQLTEWVLAGEFKHINLLSVNNVCHGGNELLDALRTRVK